MIKAGRAIVSGVMAVMTGALLSTSPAWASGDLDQSTTFAGSGLNDEVFNYGVGSQQQLSQTFTASVTGTLTTLGLGMAQQSSPTSLTLQVFAAAGGLPTGSVLTSQTLTGSGLSVVTAGQTMFKGLSTPLSRFPPGRCTRSSRVRRVLRRRSLSGSGRRHTPAARRDTAMCSGRVSCLTTTRSRPT